MGELNTNKSTYVKYPLWQKICISMGDFGGTMTWGFLSAFSMIFYTDVFGISMASVSFIMLVSRIVDAAVDPAIGVLTDHTRSRWGRYRPWVLGAIPVMVITFTLMFWAHPDWGEGQKLAYALVTYCLYVTAYSSMYIPFISLIPTLTQDPDERSSLTGIRLAMGMVSITIVSYVVLPLINALGKGDQVKGYVLAALVMSLIGAPLLLLVFFNTKEIVTPAKTQVKLGVRESLRAVKGNKPMFYAMFGQLFYYILAVGRSSVYMYYFTYSVDMVVLYGTFSMATRLMGAVGSATSGWWVERIPNKGRVVALGYIIFGATLVAQSFTDPVNSPVPFWLLTVGGNYFCGLAYGQTFAIVPDSVEYGEWKSGVRVEGTISSLVSLCNNSGQALGSFLVASIMGALGYVANQAQTPLVLNGINAIMFWGAGIMCIVMGLIFVTYSFSNDHFVKLVRILEDRRKENTASEAEN